MHVIQICTFYSGFIYTESFNTVIDSPSLITAMTGICHFPVFFSNYCPQFRRSLVNFVLLMLSFKAWRYSLYLAKYTICGPTYFTWQVRHIVGRYHYWNRHSGSIISFWKLLQWLLDVYTAHGNHTTLS